MRHSLRAAWVLVLAVGGVGGVARAAWDPVPSANLTQLNTSMFNDAELLSRQWVDTTIDTKTHDVPFLLANFRRLADSVNEAPFQAVNSGGVQTVQPGWIGLDVWRATPGDYFNARSQENVTAFAYFYTENKAWNPYYGSNAVRQRLEAILTRWVTTTATDPGAFVNGNGQYSEGTFSSNSKNFNLAATAFGTKFMGQTLAYLSKPGAPQLSAGLLDQVTAAERKSILYVLNNNSYFNTTFKNQYENIFCGALAYLDLHPEDTAVRDLFLQRYTAAHTAGSSSFQSPAGYPYESGASDFSYNLGTHGYNQQLINTYAHDATSGYLKTVKDLATAEEAEFYEWLSYNAVPLPGGGYLLNSGVATRRVLPVMNLEANSFAETVPLIRAFVPTQEELAARVTERRAAPVSDVAPLQVGEFYAYTPYDITQRDWYEWHPTEAQRATAMAQLPYVASERFTEQRVDDRTTPRQVHTFVRRPGYYAAFNAGDQIAGQQRFGLGLVWSPAMGAVMQTLPGGNALAWGTIAGGGRRTGVCRRPIG